MRRACFKFKNVNCFLYFLFNFLKVKCPYINHYGIITRKLRNLGVTIPGHFLLPGHVTWKLRNIRVTIPGDFSIGWYDYPEIALKKKHYF